MKALSLILGLSAFVAAGCEKAPATSPTTTNTTTYNELFVGTLAAKGSTFYSFSVLQPGTTKITLASVSATPGSPALPTQLGLGVGTPVGTGCADSQAQQTSASLSAQIKADLEPFIYCVRVFDVGNLAGTVSFAVRIVHP